MIQYNQMARVDVFGDLWLRTAVPQGHLRMHDLLLNVAMGYVAWDYPDDKYRLAHMAWHLFSDVPALCALTLTIGWEGRFIAYQERVASKLDEAARGEQRQASKRSQVAIRV